MAVRLSRFVRSGLLPVLIAITLFLSVINNVHAAEMVAGSNESNSIDNITEDSKDVLNGSRTSSAPDLGDDQAFPFIPGFGKNSGKD